MYKKWAPLNIEKGGAEVIVLDPSDLFLKVENTNMTDSIL
jgi:hypothetical protein